LTRRTILGVSLLVGAGVVAAAPTRTITVAAAANLKLAAEELKRGFEAQTPGVEVALTFGASGTFFSQIQNGAPFDLFLSADREYPAKVIAAGLGAAADERVYALGRLVAWLPAGSSVDLAGKGLEALADPEVKKIAIANPAVAPFGRATIAALEAAGVLDRVKPKLVMGTSVAQAAQFATTGAADVAFIPWSLAFGKELAAGRVVQVPEALYPRIEQSGIVLSTSAEPAQARAFLSFVTGEKGRAILARYGYGLPSSWTPPR
jgi:molybdate transport system substrate-binding protein